jgi:hypothetical protein
VCINPGKKIWMTSYEDYQCCTGQGQIHGHLGGCASLHAHLQRQSPQA